MSIKVPITEEDKNKSYFKYYEMEMATPPAEKYEEISKGPIAQSEALLIQDRNDLFKPGYLDCEFGYTIMEDGTGYVANHTFMPGVTGEMLQWWFAWHPLDPLRYAIWDNEDHFGIEISDEVRKKIMNPNIPLKEKSWGVTHVVQESTGGPSTQIEIMFQYPKDLGYDQEQIGTDACSFMVCANGLSLMPDGKKSAAVMTHMARDIEGGVELRSRFWMGYHIIHGQPVKLIPDGFRLPKFIPQELIGHNVKEYTNLASILPKVYAEEKNKW
ncbi:phloretin hydrolase [Alkalibaculum sp. M08DMB]|uniref:Phloretin hydrolase n=1 Tax=Alkalibaculum sporogenes TaxID=2655001 RepID=A0A6A7K5H1_9FIRM|nr:phloretin hydrolase [Alkalibaculum sporogenes]MPW24729.1 phloretin hydrolase [Alkalibaculum sporogenes]